MIGLAFFLIGAAIAAGFIVLGWKMACKAQERMKRKTQNDLRPFSESGLPGPRTL
ncbi:MAG: hypothetical protein V8T36_02045 [Ruthenibacterium lactatiformans]